jgi:hypothetical protein
MIKQLDSSIVKEIAIKLSNHYNTKMISKSQSTFILIIANILSIFKIIDKNKFMKFYATTILKTIYLPFEVGDEKNSDWSLNSQLAIITHEHQHVQQSNKLGAVNFIFKYLFNNYQRMLLEVEAYTCNLEINFYLIDDVYDIKYIVSSLKNYAISDENIVIAEDKLIRAKNLVLSKVISTESSNFVIKNLDILLFLKK